MSPSEKRVKIAVVSVARSDYSGLRPVIRKIQGDSALQLMLIVSGAHLLAEHGNTLSVITADGFKPTECLAISTGDNGSAEMAKVVAAGVQEFSRTFLKHNPDIILLYGDRFEMFAAAVAGFLSRIPLAHIHGGELTFGAIDDSLRHAISKLSHLHFVSNAEAKGRLMRMGEEPTRIVLSGAPALDEIKELVGSDEEILRTLGLPSQEKPLLITFHPQTICEQSDQAQISELLDALEDRQEPMLFTRPNADPGNEVLWKAILDFTSRAPKRRVTTENLGPQRYFSVMAGCSAMVGNTSSGIIESGSFQIPVVNIGDRQAGRTRGINVIDVACTAEHISAGIDRALSPKFRNAISAMKNPYGDGSASQRIVDTLGSISLDGSLLEKRFFDGARAQE